MELNDFNNLIGNEKIKQNLIKILNNKTIAHSYMFIGTKGIGKKEFAKEFAKGILCKKQEDRPCGDCKSCVEFINSNNPDYYEINLQENENSIKIETIRQMQKRVQELPIESERKVYIIDDSQLMTKEAQNCLLKTLEEPPTFVTIILIVSNENSILTTIKSRCLKIYFNDLSDEEIKKYIKEKMDISEFSDNMLRACGGSIGKASIIYKNKDIYSELDNIFTNVENYNLIDVISKLETLYRNKDEIQDILEYLNTIFIKKAKENIKYVDYIQYVEETKKSISANCNYDMSIDNLIFKIFKN